MKTIGAFFSTLCLAATLLSGSAAAQADAGINFFAEPAPSSSSALGYFVIEAEPGDSISQAIALRNDSKERMTLRLYAADATTSTYGGADYTAVDAETSGVGSWIVLQDDKVTLRPNEGTLVRFRVRVPDDAPTGENLGGIAIYPVVETPKTEESKTNANQASAQVVVEYRRVVAVQVNTPGKAEPDLVISGIKPTARPDGAYLDMNIANEGTALTKGQGVIRVPEFDYEREFDLDTFVPNSSIFYPLRFDDSIPNGEHEATIRIEYDEGQKVVEWSSTFAVGDELQSELAERGAPGAVPVTTRGNLVPFALALALGVLVFTFVRRRRRAEAPVAGATALEFPVVAFQPVDESEDAGSTDTIGSPAADPAPVPARYVVPPTPGAGRPKTDVKRPETKQTPAPGGSARPKKSVTARKTTPKKTSEPSGVKQTPARKAGAKKTTAKPAAEKTAARKSTATRAVAKKTASRKSVVKKSAAKKTSKKAAPKGAKKTPARKPTASKAAAAAKKSTARKTATKKAMGKKKTAVRKPTVKKTSAKKTTARKTSVKKTAAKKTSVKKAPARKSAKRSR